MATWKHIIADSGGSNTIWAFCRADGTAEFKKTRSLHPKFSLEMTEEEWRELGQELGDFSGAQLIFYGAGLGQESLRSALKEKLLLLGCGEVTAYPDTLAACRAVCANAPGTVAILGTGSVLLEYDGENITRRIGGFGSLVGDEGSGFHFARLVVRDYLSGILSEAEFSSVLGTRGEVLAKLASPSAQEWLSAVSGLLAEKELSSYHERNLRSFLELYVTQVRFQPATLSVVGSYGFYQRRILAALLAEKGGAIGPVCDSPVDALVRFHHQFR